MVPVSLRLKNFLSYRELEEPLSFESFRVACLSGANGHGKSALLDAITWVLWGEARKRSGSIKPDEDLLHRGAQEMEVELVFDLEGERYRVTRTFTLSASGKTRKTHLEVQVLNPETGTYRVLTRGSVRETQDLLENEILRIDYRTFVNSAFLLQGRSGEFTRRKPGERKEILARILNLDRYEKLAERARAEARQRKEQIQQLRAQVEQLQEFVQEEDTWKEALAVLREEVTALQEEKAAHEVALQEVQRQLARLEQQARQRELLERALEQHRQRQAQIDQRLARLREQLEGAEALMAQAEEIQARYARYQEIQEALAEWERRFEQHTGVEKLLEREKTKLIELRAEAEKALELLKQEQAHARQRRADLEAAVAELPALRRRLEEGCKAERWLQTMQEQAEKRRKLTERLEHIERQVANLRGRMESELAHLKEAVEADAVAAGTLEQLRKEQQQLLARREEARRLQEALDAVVQEGTAIREKRRGLQERMKRLEEEIREREDRIFQLAGIEAGVCPTCGTPLTPAHRAQVQQTYEEEIRERRTHLEQLAAEDRRLMVAREELAGRYHGIKQQLDGFADVEQAVARVQSQIEQLEAQCSTAAERRARMEALEARLRSGGGTEALERERQQVLEELQALPFDEERYEELQRTVARLEPLRRQIQDLETRQEELRALDEAIEHREARIARKRRELDAGLPFREVQERMKTLQQQLVQIGYDRQQHQALKEEFRALEDAGRQLMKLTEAQRHVETWRQEIGELTTERASSVAEGKRLQQDLEALERQLAARASVEATSAEHRRKLEAVEARLAERLARQGELEERVRRSRETRTRIRELRQQLREVQKEHRLYRHLQRAFGKHGIPSLIIEETLPDIERRANELLDRLTGGRTHVYLETLREKKQGGTAETLEIQITDETGQPRPYETYSGGEAFRVDFALRVALAQLLAERSGVRIRTLVIDEGFGTQDAEGRQQLIEAIRSIQEDFDKILVITHLEEFKNAFPTRIQVWKDPAAGSRYEVLEA